jgi:2-oxoglutarate dehydrogenase E2 component (dihydrolipoamide succinyltransferase)
MATEVEIPSLGESVLEATLLRWKKEEGEAVRADEPICELETDKANVDLPAPAAGKLHRIKAEGQTVKIGEVIARIDDNGSAKAAAPAQAKASRVPMPPPPKEPTEFRPSVRRLLEENKLSPEKIPATGPHGQITKEDVLEVLASEEPFPAPAASPAEGVRREPMSKIRRRIAERLVSAQHQAAMLTTFNEVDMTAVLELRQRYKQRFQETHGVTLGLTSFFARACAQALLQFPIVNASIEGEEILYYPYVHLGIAVSTERGLVVPVLRNVEKLSVARIELEIKRMATAAQAGKLGVAELIGGTFTITNGGVFGSLLSTPILNPPQSGILGMHSIQQRPMGVGGKIELRSMMYVALSYDHRLVDGKDSVRFLVRVKEFIEDPARLLLEI